MKFTNLNFSLAIISQFTVLRIHSCSFSTYCPAVQLSLLKSRYRVTLIGTGVMLQIVLAGGHHH